MPALTWADFGMSDLAHDGLCWDPP